MSSDTNGVAPTSPENPHFRLPTKVVGPRLSFRLATVADAEFILSLRLDESKNKYLSRTSPDLDAQREWLAHAQDGQLYFIIEMDRPVGTVRLYDQRGTSFCWGSWILNEDAPKSSAIESTLMVYHLGLELGFTASHFDVRKGNEKVWRYHERLGAERVGETDEDYLYCMDKDEILDLFVRYEDRLKGPIQVQW